MNSIEEIIASLPPEERPEAEARFKQFLEILLEIDLERLHQLLHEQRGSQRDGVGS